MPPGSTDQFASTISAARSGDQQAWRSLYDRHASPVLGYLRAQRAPSPEDLLGEVWLQAVRDLPRFAGDEAGFRAWLLTIAHNRLLDARRAAARRPAELSGAELVDGAGGIEEAAADRVEAEHELARLLEGMPERHRSVLYLRFVLDMPQRDVAHVLGVSTPAMKMLQARAVRSLEKRVAELEAAGEPPAALPSAARRRLDE